MVEKVRKQMKSGNLPNETPAEEAEGKRNLPLRFQGTWRMDILSQVPQPTCFWSQAGTLSRTSVAPFLGHYWEIVGSWGEICRLDFKTVVTRTSAVQYGKVKVCLGKHISLICWKPKVKFDSV